ncbi:hypothetical protein FRC07_004531 [Ceratobasidium sp. 392]|nr:hypothetical protein FRC07_004531 [Ceratobasidium sp. 392]
MQKHYAVVTVPQEYHAELIGQHGRYANRLEAKYGIRITFAQPAEAPSAADDDASTGIFTATNTVLVEGPQAGVEEARDELLELYRWNRENEASRRPTLIWVPRNVVGAIIGREGRMIETIQQQTGTQIRIHTEEEWATDSATISLRGEQTAVDTAIRRIRGIEAKIGREAVRMAIDPKYYPHLIGADGQALKSLIIRAGGPTSSNAQARIIVL